MIFIAELFNNQEEVCVNKFRYYQDEIGHPVLQLQSRFEVTCIDHVLFGNKFIYPFYRIIARSNGEQANKKDILISGIVHGDEPAGGIAILKFLDTFAEAYLDRFNFYCYPCVNPSGFETDRRENMNFVNLNRSFKTPSAAQEIAYIHQSLKRGPEKYHLTIDMHESSPLAIDPKEKYGVEDNPNSFWMWETATIKSGLRIGDKVVSQLSKEGVDICSWPKIYDDVNNGGVIWYPEGHGNEFYASGTDFDGYLYNRYTDHSFTVETPTCWALDRRIHTHVRALCLILEASV